MATLSRLQAWFGKAISRPLPQDYPGNPLALSAPELARSAQARLWSRGGLSGFDRLGLYNQQYWFRLITILQSEYPCSVHVLGLRAFNRWAVRYLTAHPPDSPFLAFLDASLPAFMEKTYRGKNRKAVLQAVAYDRAFSKAVDAPDGEPLASRRRGAADAASLPLCLAPHATPLKLDWDFAAYRAECLEDESLERRIKLAKASSHVLVYRDRDFALRQAEVAPAAYRVLAALQAPTTVAAAFAGLERRLKAKERRELEARLAGWFRDWVAAGWLGRAEAAPPRRRGGRKGPRGKSTVTRKRRTW